MSPNKNMIAKIPRLLRFFLDPRKDIEVFGMFGPGNLGDEAMMVAASEVLGKARTLPYGLSGNRFLAPLARRRTHRNLLVSGGTLIHGGQPGWLEYVEHRAAQGVRISVFGTGMAFTPEQIRERSEHFRRWSRVLKDAAHVQLRGPRSVGIAAEMGVRAEIFGDFAFMLYDPLLPLADHGIRRDTIGFNFGQCLGDQQAFEDSAAALVRHYHCRHRLVFHAVIASDIPVIRRIAAAAGLSPAQTEIRSHFYDPIAFMHDVHCYRAFFGLKLHAAALAMMAGVPTLMVAYLPKAHDLIEGLGGGQHLVLDLPLETEVAIARMNEILANPDDAVLTDLIAPLASEQKKRLQAAFA